MVPADGQAPLGPRPSAGRVMKSQWIHTKYHWILDNEQRNPIINRVQAHTKVSNWAKYE